MIPTSIRWWPLVLGLLALGCPTGEPDDDAADDDSAGEPPACDEGLVLDGDVCVPEACGVGNWGELDPAAVAVFVDGAAEDGGDGSETSPLRWVQDGIDAAAALGGGTVALAAGTYLENLVLGDDAAGVHLVGRCRELVTLDGSGDPGASGVLIDGTWGVDDLEIADVTIAAAEYIGVWIEAATVTLRRVEIRDSGPLGLLVYRSSTAVTLQDVIIAGTRPDAVGDWGYAINVYEGARLTADGLLIEDNVQVGVMENGAGTVVQLRDAVVRYTATAPNGSYGWGLAVFNGAELSCDGCTVEGNASMAVLAADEGSANTLRDCVVSDTLPDGNDQDGYGVAGRTGATIAVIDSVLQRNTIAGVYADGYGTLVTLENTDIRDTWEGTTGSYGQGVMALQGATVSLTGGVIERHVNHGLHGMREQVLLLLDAVTVRDTQTDSEGNFTLVTDCLFERNVTNGLFAYDGARLELAGTTVRETLPSPLLGYGRAVELQLDAELSASDCLFEDNVEVGLLAYDGSSAERSQVTIRGTAPRADGTHGLAVALEEAATLVASGCLFEDNADVSVYARHPGTALTLTDTIVRGTRPTPEGEFGRGIEIRDGVTLALHGCTLEGNTEVGLVAYEPDTTVTITDTQVTGTQRSLISAVGTGVDMEVGAALDAAGLVVTGSEGPGLALSYGSHVSCQQCVFEGNALAGVVVQQATLSLLDSTISGTLADANLGGGVGLLASGGMPATAIELDGCTVEDHLYAALWIQDTGDYHIHDSTLRGGAGVSYQYPNGDTVLFHGNAVYATGGVTAWDGAQGLRLENNLIADSAGPAILLHGASATLASNTYAGNTLDLLQQSCDGVDPPDGLEDAPTSQLCPAYDLLVLTLTFGAYFQEHQPLE